MVKKRSGKEVSGVYLDRGTIEIRGVGMYLTRAALLISRADTFAKFLMGPGLSSSDVSKFIVLDTFSEYKPSASHIFTITEDGHLAPAAFFGASKETMNSWGNIPLTLEAPLTDAVKQNQVIELKQSEVAERYPILQQYDGVPDKWETYLVTPVNPHGVFALTLHTSPEVDQEFEIFLRTIGTLIMLHKMREEVRVPSLKLKNLRQKNQKSGVLTIRQTQIRRLIEKGLTNHEIAEEIGYSESLVRHETMEIYATLNVSGRKDLLDNPGSV